MNPSPDCIGGHGLRVTTDRAANLLRGEHGDRGAASILLLAVGLVLVAAGLAGAAVEVSRVGRHQAQVAADLGALAGAADAIYGEPEACARAARFAAANGARTTSCTVTGLEIVIRVEVPVRPMPSLLRHATAAARAGPVTALSAPS